MLPNDFPRSESSAPSPGRKRPAHGVVCTEGQPTIVFLTVCTKNRRSWLASQDVHDTLIDVWTNATAWIVGRYVVMPDHIHLFAGMIDETIPLDNWVRYWKSQFTRQHKRAIDRWQPDHWDTRMRNEPMYEAKWRYVYENPVRQGLVDRPELWPFQGGLFDCRWS
jgi:putative transposase